MARPKGSRNKPKDGKTTTKKKGGAKEREKFTAPVNTKTGTKGPATQGPKGAPAAADQPAVTAKDMQRIASKKYLNELIDELAGLKGDMSEVGGTLREKIAYGVSHKFIDKNALADVRKWDDLFKRKGSNTIERTAARWHTFIRYMELRGLMAKIEAVGRLPLGDEPAGGDEVEQEDGEAAEAAQELQPANPPADQQPQGEQAGEQEQDGAGNVTRAQFGQRAAGPVH